MHISDIRFCFPVMFFISRSINSLVYVLSVIAGEQQQDTSTEQTTGTNHSLVTVHI